MAVKKKKFQGGGLMLLSSGQVNKIWSELLPGCLIHFYSKWLGNFPEVGSVGSRLSSGFVCSYVSPSWLAAVAVSPQSWENGEQGNFRPARHHVLGAAG